MCLTTLGFQTFLMTYLLGFHEALIPPFIFFCSWVADTIGLPMYLAHIGKWKWMHKMSVLYFIDTFQSYFSQYLQNVQYITKTRSWMFEFQLSWTWKYLFPLITQLALGTAALETNIFRQWNFGHPTNNFSVMCNSWAC